MEEKRIFDLVLVKFGRFLVNCGNILVKSGFFLVFFGIDVARSSDLVPVTTATLCSLTEAFPEQKDEN